MCSGELSRMDRVFHVSVAGQGRRPLQLNSECRVGSVGDAHSIQMFYQNGWAMSKLIPEEVSGKKVRFVRCSGCRCAERPPVISACGNSEIGGAEHGRDGNTRERSLESELL